jgi:N6-adenosine-specific RNA methylase IME4
MTSTEWPFGDLEPRSYGCICADPPWLYKTHTEQVADLSRGAMKHYSVMGLKDIIALPVRDLAAKDCHLFIWTTGPHLKATFDVIRAWGFAYSGVAFTWVKLKRSHKTDQLRFLPSAESDLHVGLGYTTRKNAEFCLLARRGNARRVAKDVREIIMAPVREHSRKPEEFRDRVERYVGPDVRICELFARSTRENWASWGNETQKYEAA